MTSSSTEPLRCDACSDRVHGEMSLAVCFLTMGTFTWSGEADLYEQDAPAITTRALCLCRRHRHELLQPLERLARQVTFAGGTV